MTDISDLVGESQQKWNKAYDVLLRVSCEPAEPVPSLTGPEMERLLDFSKAYRELLVRIGLLPRSVSKLDLNNVAK